jgi:hypothetical protein
MKPALVLAVCLTLFGCTHEPERLRAEIAAQEEKVAAAQTTHNREVARLKTMQDSLQIKIQQNMALGLDRKQATELEQALLKSQRTLLEAAGQNLKRQREYLARLKERLHTFSGSP